MSSRLVIFLFLISCFSAKAQQQISVFFDSNKSIVNAKEKQRLTDWIINNTTSKIVAIHGFTDEDGTNTFNDSLAQKRVDFVFNFIQDKVKIRDDFKTRSFGESRQTSKIKAENRKVIIYYIEEKDLPRENEILGIKPEPVKPEPIAKPEVSYPEKLTFDNPDGTKSTFKLDREFMKQIGLGKKGEKLALQNLNFVINTFAIVPESRGKLYELLLVMQKNPGMKIDIQGHLCCMPSDKQDLSTKRAKAIYSFLVTYGIDKERLSYRGFGSSKAIYPIPEQNEEQRAANRRVEIEIIENP
ncbi:OmpA family protein [Flavobacterium sp. 3HN19-14]|uniref:OmpA family protein n=1 Tax=Flavobacterium sp. 3HN19-14 TaxID=3448133 RepID=UPI003EE06851